MKSYTLAALATVVCAVAPANAATVKEYLTACDELISTFNLITAALNSVHDKTSADAAAPTVTICLRKMVAAQARFEAMGEFTPSQKAQVRAIRPNLEQELDAALEEFNRALEKAVGDESKPCYGSVKLRKALESVE